MKTILIGLLLLTVYVPGYSQVLAPDIQWQKTYGGMFEERISSIQPTRDKGYIFVGLSNSRNGDITTNHGGYDYWVVKIDSMGTIYWQKSFGGLKDDVATSVKQTPDGGYIVVGTSSSNDGDVTGHHGTNNSNDIWVIKLTAAGAIQWQKSLGGSSGDGANTVRLTSDGGYIIAGTTSSTDGDVSGYHPSSGYGDCWIVKLSSTGTIQWQKAYGGSSGENVHDVLQTSDGGYILAAETSSRDGDVANNTNIYVCGWIVKLDNTGAIQWQKIVTFPGFQNSFRSIQQTTDGGYITVGAADKYDGSASGGYGAADCLVLKLSSTGATQWQKFFGGYDYDYPASIQQLPGGSYIIGAYSTSNNNDVSGNHGNYDCWLLKINADGSKIWQKSIGGSDMDITAEVMPTADKGYIVGAYTSSKNGDVTSNHSNPGYNDAWVVKLYDDSAIHSQTINFPALPAKTLLDADFTLTATTNSGLPITYTSSDTTVASIVSGNKVHIKTVGTTSITASQAGNTNYMAAMSVTQVLTITKATQIITFNSSLARRALDGDFNVNFSVSSHLPLTLKVVDTTVAVIVDSNRVHVKKAGYINITATQSGNSIYSPASLTAGGSLSGASQTLSFPVQPAYLLCNSPATLIASASSGLPVSFTSSDTAIVAIKGSLMYFKKAGTVTVYAWQDGDLYYFPTNSIARNIVVSGTDTANATPSISIRYTPSLTTVCAGTKQVVTFLSSIKNGGGAPAYRWLKNGVLIATTSTYTGSFFQAGTTNIKCVLISSARCVTSRTDTSNTLSITVHALPVVAPTIKVVSYIPNACLTRAVTFQASITNGGTAPFYQWKKNGNNVGTNSLFYIDSLLLNTDSVWCILTSNTACLVNNPVASAKIKSNVVYNVPVKPSAISGPVNVHANQKYIGFIINRVNDVSYTWVVPPGCTIIDGQGTNQIAVNWGSATGSVIVRAKNVCGQSDSSRLMVHVAASFSSGAADVTEDESKTTGKEDIQLYPNPAVNSTYISFTSPEAGKYFIQVTDAQGRIMQTKETNAVKGNNKVTVDVSRYTQGVYFVRIAGANRQQSLRLLIQR